MQGARERGRWSWIGAPVSEQAEERSGEQGKWKERQSEAEMVSDWSLRVGTCARYSHVVAESIA